jgi:Flp pilus assembly protein TadG
MCRLRSCLEKRSAAAAVEFAIIMSIVLGPLVVGMIEMGRGLTVKQVLSDAARKGCRTGILPTGNDSDITTDVNKVLDDNNITSSWATITIMVNGVIADPSTAKQGDQISVKVSVPVSRIALVTPMFLPGTDIESDTLIMMRQQ